MKKMQRGRFLTGLAGMVAAGATAANAASQQYAVVHTDSDWLKLLGEDRYQILRQNGTEPAFSSPLLSENRTGVYYCAGCRLAVFSSAAKYDSGDGWPSFRYPLPGTTLTQTDDSIPGMPRTEVHCERCGGHLGHIFDDGPPPAYKRYCIDGLALRFVPGGKKAGG
jgi:peptide-methionine (R)-S-oxide reductase